MAAPRQLNQIVDGFTYNNFFRELPVRLYEAQLGQMDVLRRANNYRPRWYVAPDNLNDPITAYETFEMQIRITPRSYLWGFTFFSFDAAGGYEPQFGGDVLVSVTEACNGVAMFSEFATAAGLQGLQRRGSNTGVNNPNLLMQPRLILEPGLVNVEISNRLGTDQYCQLVLFCAEPCEVVMDE